MTEMIKIEGKKFDWFGLTQILKEHKGKLRQIRMLSVNELKKKYKGAALGPLCRRMKVKKLKVGHAGTLDPLATGNYQADVYPVYTVVCL